MANLDSILKSRHYFANKAPSSQSYGFSGSHVWMCELDYKESWEPKNWCFWAVVSEKTLESPLDCKKIKSVNPKGNQSWRTDVEAETPILWPTHVKNRLLGKDPDAGKDWRQDKLTELNWNTIYPKTFWYERMRILYFSISGRSAHSLSGVWLFAAQWTAARQASLSITNSQSLLKLMSIESVRPSNYLSSSVVPFCSCLQYLA